MKITEAVKLDRKLEADYESSRLKLAEHRWHWTLDESNPDRVSIREYARKIGRGKTTVDDMVRAYAEWVLSGAHRTEFADYQTRAKLRGETLIATEAVAESRGVSLEAARRHHAQDVREVKAAAAERAERKGSTASDEMADVARHRERTRQSSKQKKQDQQKRHTHRYLVAEGKIATAMRNLRSVLDDSEGVEFSAEERDLLADSLSQLRALLNLLDVRLTGDVDVDWDAEMAKLTEDR